MQRKTQCKNDKCECRAVFDAHADANIDASVNGPLDWIVTPRYYLVLLRILKQDFSKIFSCITRMHSSRIHIARSFTVKGMSMTEIPLDRELPWTETPPRQRPPVDRDPLSPVNRIADMCKKYYLASNFVCGW